MLKTYHFIIICAFLYLHLLSEWQKYFIYSGVLLYFFPPTLSSVTLYW